MAWALLEMHRRRDIAARPDQKGAYVLYLLREKLGEHDFWKGIRA